MPYDESNPQEFYTRMTAQAKQTLTPFATSPEEPAVTKVLKSIASGFLTSQQARQEYLSKTEEYYRIAQEMQRTKDHDKMLKEQHVKTQALADEQLEKATRDNEIAQASMAGLTEGIKRQQRMDEARTLFAERKAEEPFAEKQPIMGSPEWLRAQEMLADIKARHQLTGKVEGVDIDAMAQGILDQTLTSVQIPKRGAVWSQVVSKVKEINPKFNFQFADANYKWYTSTRASSSITFLKGSLPRVTALLSQANQLPNSSWVSWNALKRAAWNEVGLANYTEFEANRNAIIQEVNTALSGSSQPSDTRVKLELENLQGSRSPAQLKAAINNLNEALLARLDASMYGPFPKEVVNGEMTLKEYMADTYKRYKGNYAAVEGTSTEGALGSSRPQTAEEYLKSIGGQ